MPIADFKTQFDDDVLPAGRGTGNLGYSGNGRQIVATPDGRFIAGFSQAPDAAVFTGGRTPAGRRVVATRRSLFLVVQDGPAGRIVPFGDPLLLAGAPVDGRRPVFVEPAGDDTGRPEHSDGQCGAPTLAIRDGLLHVYWLSGGMIWHTATPVPEAGVPLPAEVSGWQRLDGSAGADSLADGRDVELGEVVVTPRGLAVLFSDADGLHLMQPPLGKESSATRIADAGINPVAAVSSDGTLHVAYERDRQIYYCRTTLGEARDPVWRSASGHPGPELVGHFPASRPSMVLHRDRPLIAFQGEGVVSLADNLHLYPKLRAAGGTTISWCCFDGEAWARGEVIRSQEILQIHQQTAEI